MYWVLSNELVDEDFDADLSGDVNIKLGGDTCFNQGAFIRALVPKIILTLNNSSHIGRMTDHLSVTEIYGLVFSTRLRELLHHMTVDNIQYFDLDIVNPKKMHTYTDYKIANVVGVIDCINKNKSDLLFFDDGDISFIKKLALDESKIPPELKIFTLANYTSLPIVHQEVKDAIVDAGITGCVFYKSEEYH